MTSCFAISPLNFDAQASTPPDPRVIETMLKTLQSSHANPHASHFLGMQANAQIEQARCSIARLIGGFEENVVFTSGATEANNQVITSIFEQKYSERKTVLVSAVEHKSVSEPIFFYAEKYGFEVKEIPVNSEGLIDIEKYKVLLAEKPLFVSIIAVNNEIGVIQDIKSLAKLAQDSGAVFHTDAAQAVQVVDIASFIDNVDFLTLSAHKFYGPQGIGALYFSPSMASIVQPLVRGGGQQSGLRSGTLPTFLCAGMGKAAELMAAERERVQEHYKEISKYFLACLAKNFIAYRINGSIIKRHFGNLNIQFPSVDAEELLNSMQPSVNASSGSACNSGNIESSKVLRAIGLDKEQAKCSIRFSFLKDVSKDDIDEAVGFILSKLRSLSI